MDFKKRLIVGLTAKHGKDWKKKLDEIRKYKIKRFALFLEEIPYKEREKVYVELLNTKIDEIPLVHIRDDFNEEEILFLKKNFKSKYFTIHESHFKLLKKWNGTHKNLYLEMNFDDYVPKNVEINKIGGFCIDLSHFKAAEEKWSKDFLFIESKKKIKRYFKCNHINGYSYKKNLDIHTIRGFKDFDYLMTLPEFLFGDVIALEMYNSIKDQIEYKKYLEKLLNKKFN
ncbi:MAG: hypothetical protein WC867_06515 [Candidatus Pacearchaeota archaeon]|jgi:hypothetical protein